MPRAFYALLLCLFFCIPLTPLVSAPPPAGEGFNVSLKDGSGKSTAAASDPRTSFKVVLDAGHGGKDPGGMGINSQEKEIALNITRLLALGIRTNFPRVEVVLTRSDDTFIPLYERAAIANEGKADLFISIHANIMPGSSATRGTETFVMGQHVAKHNLAVAKRENAAVLLEDQDRVKENYGYDPNSDEGHILMSAFQHAFLERSILFADLVEKQFAAAGRKSRGVKQAGFVVLKETTMPSVLVETGFMSNPDEEAYLLSGKGQQALANALLKAFQNYYRLMVDQSAKSTIPQVRAVASKSTPKYTPTSTKTGTSAYYAQLSKPVSQPTDVRLREVTPSVEVPPARSRQWTAKGGSRPAAYGTAPVPVSYATKPYEIVKTAVQPVPQAYQSVLSREVRNRLAPGTVRYAASPAAADSVPGGYAFKEAKVRKNSPVPAGPDLSLVADQQLTYAVQVFATKRKLDLSQPMWRAVPYPIELIKEKGYNKYQIRTPRTAKEALSVKANTKAAGIKEAMVVVYYRGQRLEPEQVQYLLTR